MNAAISIQHLSKKYTLSQAAPYLALRDVITHSFQNFFHKKKKETFWALKDIDLQIEQGERVGIIGHNGAGKSTLLKIISHITPPTTGKIILEGRVASLLEVGTGFHPELTGRENIYLNGSILGLKKAEINQKLEEIIDFSGVEKFIDTPLKHYSSGMQLRLAFSVAAHLEPEILLIDEVLAVGDMEFQKKCMGKMEEVSKEKGRTILFVSHNLEVIEKFCQRTVLLSEGALIKEGRTKEIIQLYISNHHQVEAKTNWTSVNAPTNGQVKLLEVFAHDRHKNSKSFYYITETVGISFTYEVLENGVQFTHGVNVFNDNGVNVFDSHDNYTEVRNEKRTTGTYQATVWIPPNLLTDGRFSIGIALFSQQPFYIFIHPLHVIRFTVIDELSSNSARGNYSGYYGGLVRPLLKWQAHKIR